MVAIAADSQADRSGCFAVHDQLVSLNGQPLALSGGASFEQQLGTIAVGTKVLIEIIKPERLAQGSTEAALSTSSLRSALPGASASGAWRLPRFR